MLYGERRLVAIEVRRTARVRDEDLRGPRRFVADHPVAQAFLLHLGPRGWHDRGVEVLPPARALPDLRTPLEGPPR